MNTKTKNILIISVVTVLFFVSSLTFLVFEINKRGLLLEEQNALLVENNRKESTYFSIRRTIHETEEEREQLSNKFFKDDNDSITFLNEIESLASGFGLVLKTDALEIVTEEGKSSAVKMVFVYNGTKNKVINFTKIMENLPYHSYVESFSFKEISVGNWEGKITLLVTMETI